MSFLSSYQTNLYGDLYQNFMPMTQNADGSSRALSAIEICGQDLFSPDLLYKMGIGMNPQGSSLAMDFGGGFNSMYSTMWANKMDQPMMVGDTVGASWNQFEYGLRNGQRGERKDSGGWFG